MKKTVETFVIAIPLMLLPLGQAVAQTPPPPRLAPAVPVMTPSIALPAPLPSAASAVASGQVPVAVDTLSARFAAVPRAVDTQLLEALIQEATARV
jgi:hypothetical protein